MDELTPPAGEPTILCINVGSSSLKGSLYRFRGLHEPRRLAAAEVPAGVPADGPGDVPGETREAAPPGRGALDGLLASLIASHGDAPAIVAHRVVHGGPALTEHAVLDDTVRARLDAAVPFAPLHLPREIDAIDAIDKRYPGAAQVVCLDTAFHRTMPEAARHLALPRWLHDEGVERYGFHGLSYEFVVDHVGAATLGRSVVAHLGSGASLAAIAAGRSVDTTMGLTPSGGVVMATRSGDLDPGVLLYLLRRHAMRAEQIEQLIDHESGLLGIAGSTGDMVALLARRSTDPRAALAVEVFCHSVRKAIGALAAGLGGLDTLVFTAGIGENAPAVRERVCDGLGHLGVEIDAARNDAGAAVVSAEGSGVVVRVVRTDENLMLARHAAHLCGHAGS